MKTKASDALRARLRRPGIVVAPGAYDCLTAKLIESSGAEAVYMTGAGTSVARLGVPDLGLATMDDMVANAAAIAQAVDVPVIADADTGYGGAINAARAVRRYEDAGVAAIHLEDQVFPKRCGHLAGKRVVPTREMVEKLRAAAGARSSLVLIARTDGLAVTGWDDTLRRCEAYVKAGADALFVEAIRSRAQARTIAARFDVPLLYNVVESGRSPLLSARELERLGFKIAIFPVSALLLVVRAVGDLMRELRAEGTTRRSSARMATLEQCFELVGLSRWLASSDAARAKVRKGGT